MSNMSYCRFRNTLRDLQDCADAISLGQWSDTSGEEKDAFVELLDLCKHIAQWYDENESEVADWVYGDNDNKGEVQ